MEENFERNDEQEIVSIQIENLAENPNNIEVVDNVDDVVLSIEENGFVGAIIVTDFGMDEGRYMVVSGHRRLKACKERGMVDVPCIIRHYGSEEEMLDEMLLSQSSRDSSKDPLILLRRFRANRSYLDRINYQGSIRKEIARRLGLTTRQVERYRKLDKIIDPICELVETKEVAISSVEPISTLPENEQRDIYERMLDLRKAGKELTRDTVIGLVKDYKASRDTAETSGNDDVDADEYQGASETGGFNAEEDIVDATQQAAEGTDSDSRDDQGNSVRELLMALYGQIEAGVAYEPQDHEDAVQMRNIMRSVSNWLLANVARLSEA